MDIKRLAEGAWMTVTPKAKNIGPLEFKVRPMPESYAAEFRELKATGPEIVAKFSELIEDWKLELDGAPVPCDDPNKRRYLGYLLRLVDASGEFSIGIKIFEFAANLENFLGN